MKPSVTIAVTDDISITLSGAQAFQDESGEDFRITGYDEVRIRLPDRTLLWRVDSIRPDFTGKPDDWEDRSQAHSKDIRRGAGGRLELPDDGKLALRFHLHSPLTPFGLGVFVHFELERDKARLTIDNESHLYVCKDQATKWERARSHPGPPSHLPTFQEFLETGWRCEHSHPAGPARGNSLLTLKPHVSAANLVDLKGPGGTGEDATYQFSLRPRQLSEREYLVTTTFFAAAPRVAGAPVSGRALGLEYAERASAPLAAEVVDLTCFENELRDGWTLFWSAVPGQLKSQRRETLSLATLSHQLCRHYSLGLAATRSRNRLSFAPTRISSDRPVSLEFALTAGSSRELVDTLFRKVRLDGSHPLALEFAGALDFDGRPLTLATIATRPAARTDRKDWIAFELQPSTTVVWPELAVGAVAVGAHELTGGSVRLSIREDAQSYGQAPLGLDVRLKFKNALYRAVSVDPELGFETLSADVDRERPWALDLNGEREAPQYCSLEVRETADAGHSRVLQFQLRQVQDNAVDTDVILIDRSPLTVVRVKTTEKCGPDELLAEYIDDSDQAPEWRFYSTNGEMVVVLPPQGIGEEMIKGYLHLTTPEKRVNLVPRAGRPFDFRLTPNALLTLDRSDIDTRRSEAPWSLRRLLAQRLGVTGVKLVKSRLELLYGLQLEFETAGLRLVELDGMVGRIPYGSDLQDLLRDLRREGHHSTLEEQHAERLAGWIASLWHRPSWWRVIRDFTDRSRLSVDEKVAFHLRPTRQTAHPFEIGKYAVDAQYTNPEYRDLLIPPADRIEREPLRGGVDWPFQSPNLYTEFRDDSKPGVGSVDGLAFGTLGGEGVQTAVFNNGKTLIISSTRQGRLDSVTLIRVGRIGMLWNKARHVIVYERTTRRAQRYGIGPEPKDGEDSLEFQPEFPRFAALRKVREYVEITEPRRRYPDMPTTGHLAGPLAGPLQQSVFDSTVIPVKSTWGYDIPDGFVIALHGPHTADEARFFPVPKIFLDLARAPGKGEGSIAQRIRDPQQLVFFSSTRADDTGETDQWPAWPDVDFPITGSTPRPELPTSASFTGRARQPSAASADYGLRRFTLDLEPTEEAVNLLHGRNVPGLEAKLFNVCLSRSRPATVLPPDSIAARLAPGLGAFDTIAKDGLSELSGELSARLEAEGTMPLRDLPLLQKDARLLLERLKEAAASLPDATWKGDAPAAADWNAEQDRRFRDYRAAVAATTDSLVKQGRTDLGRLDGDINVARTQALHSVEALCTVARQKIVEVSVVPDLARGAVERLGQLLLQRVDALTAKLGADVEAVLVDLERQIGSGTSDADTLELLWRDSTVRWRQQLRSLVDEAESMMDSELGRWFSRRAPAAPGGDTIFDKIRVFLDRELLAVVEWFERWLADMPPFSLGWPNIAEIRRLVAAVLAAPKAAVTAIQTSIIQELQKVGAPWQGTIDQAGKQVEDWCKTVASAITEALDIEHIRNELESALNGLADTMTTAITTLQTNLETALESIPWKEWQGDWDGILQIRDQTDLALKNITDALAKGDATLAELAASVRGEADTIRRELQASATQLETIARDEARQFCKVGQQAADAGLETLRTLAEGPVTDTIRVSRDALGYYYDKAKDELDVTRASALFNGLGQDTLNALSTNLPFDRIRDRLLPQLSGLAVRDLLPNFGGLQLTDLLPDLDIPIDDSHEYGWVRLAHGFDKDRMTAWAKVDIDKQFEDSATLFDLGPVKLRLLRPRFTALSRIEIGKNGSRTQKTWAELLADWEMSLSDKPMVTMREGLLRFDEAGELHFAFDAEKLELAQELQFVTDALRALKPEVEGLTITPLLPAGISAELSLPLPDIGTGAFTLTGITLNSHLDLLIADGFEIRTGLWLSKPDRPFGLAVLFLGGGGWFGIDVSYRPPSRFVTQVSIGLSAGAFLAVNFGFAHGSAGLLFTAGVDFYRDFSNGRGTTALSIGILMWGEFSILGIASASIRLIMRVTYKDGAMTGYGVIRVSIRICWCYTLNLSRSINMPFAKPAGGGGGSKSPGILNKKQDKHPAYAELGKPSSKAVDDHFSTLKL